MSFRERKSLALFPLLITLFAVSMVVTSCGTRQSIQTNEPSFSEWKSAGNYDSVWPGCDNPYNTQSGNKWRIFQVKLYTEREAAAYCLSQKFAYGYSVLIQKYGSFKVNQEVTDGQIKFDDLILKYKLQTEQSIHNFCLAYQERVKKVYEDGGYRNSDTEYWPGGFDTDAGLYDWGFGPKAEPAAFIRGCELGTSSRIAAAVLSMEDAIAADKALQTQENIRKRKEEEAKKKLVQQNQKNEGNSSPGHTSGSSGQIVIPNFLGQNRSQVLKFIADSKLPLSPGFGAAIGIESSIACELSNNAHVITQTPKPGTRVNYKSGGFKVAVNLGFDC